MNWFILPILCALVCPTVRPSPDAYDMLHRKRGICIIINNHQFEPDTKLYRRDGTFADADNIKRSFERLQFECREYVNRKKADMMTIFRRLASQSFQDHDTIAIFFLTHGRPDGVMWATDELFQLSDVTTLFNAENCPTLVGKPKLFFVQACRGKIQDPGVDVVPSRKKRTLDPMIPMEADYLVAYSVPEGHYSWRNAAYGTWFIRSLSEAINQYAPGSDFLTILTRACYICATEYMSNTGRVHNHEKKQMPQITSTLLKDIIFR